MKLALAYTLILCFSSLALASEVPNSACAGSLARFNELLARVDRSCKSDSDCAISDLDYNPCLRRDAAGNKWLAQEKDKAVAAIRETRSKAWKDCGFVMPPCVHDSSARAACQNEKCIRGTPSPVHDPEPSKIRTSPM